MFVFLKSRPPLELRRHAIERGCDKLAVYKAAANADKSSALANIIYMRDNFDQFANPIGPDKRPLDKEGEVDYAVRPLKRSAIPKTTPTTTEETGEPAPTVQAMLDALYDSAAADRAAKNPSSSRLGGESRRF